MRKPPDCKECGYTWFRRDQPKRAYIRTSKSDWDHKTGYKRTQKWVAVGWFCPKCKGFVPDQIDQEEVSTHTSR